MKKESYMAMYYVGQPWIGTSAQFDSVDKLPKHGDTVIDQGGHRLLVLRERQKSTRNELTDLVTHYYDCELKTNGLPNIVRQ